VGVHQIIMDYNLGGSRRRSLGLGILTGDALNGGNLINGLQSNLQFRLNSAMDALSGSSSMTPMTRRKEIMQRRRSLLTGDMGSDSSSSGTSSSSSRGGSGRISQSKGGKSSSPSSSSGTPSMSDVNVGTKARAEERGFSG
jgi:hypothetical protein